MAPQSAKTNYTILIVEDDVGLQYLIKTKLESQGYHLVTALSGADAIYHIKQGDVFLMLLDYKLTDITGKELLEKLVEEGIEVPFIFMTGYGDEKVAVEIMKLGAKEYLVKSGEFLNQIEGIVKRVIKEIESDEKLKKMQKELESLNNMKSHFLNMISQEIRTPLTGISGALHLLRNQEFSSTIKGLLETLQNSVYRLDDFANKTILSTQLSSEKYELHTSDINAKELIQYCCLELTNEILDRSVEIVEEIDAGLSINGDRDLLYKAFLYIIENAVANSKLGGKIDIVFVKEGDMATCSVIDNSDSYIEDPMELLLNPFQETSQNVSTSFGLSLFLINQIVTLHSGKINIFNNENGGLCVELTFSTVETRKGENE